MSWHQIKRDKSDILFSKYIRHRDGKCVFPDCTYKGAGEEGIVGLDASHFHSRRKESVRYDPDNVDSLCRKHHKYLGEHKTEYEKWKRNQLGEDRYNLLQIRAETYAKKDRVMAAIIAKELLNSLKR